ncbi:Pfam:PGAM [Seminavis robusta]|uniref:Pfam:PGAM n=1 Tax=Seminavis robusta TaxID=568900 RepID=A0A9N8DYA2_9STRA|nr:Pfam:PGAM [Seminavis robusta]|eukprot:Sro364_g127130.1 Pfam:PGAM (256) ;mRNA; f:34455-35222
MAFLLPMLLLILCLFSWLPLASTTATDNYNLLLNRSPSSLRNEYWVLRHGQSQANVAKLIASSPEIACQKYGLSDVGKEQAALAGDEAVEAFHERNTREPRLQAVVLLSSDLLRAKETAEIVRDKLILAGIPLLYQNVGEPRIDKGLAMETRLRERWFGEWDETSDTNYPNVWKDDAEDADHTIKGVESVNQVVSRSTKCICDWDERLERCMVICVAHGDVLQIMQTGFAKMDPTKHRTLEHLETAKLRRLELKE